MVVQALKAEQVVVVVLMLQALEVEEVVWGEPYGMELEYSFCSSSAAPNIKVSSCKIILPEYNKSVLTKYNNPLYHIK